MKAIITSAILLAVLASTLFGQQVVDLFRGIEVTGTAERMVTPDEFTFRIVLSERQGPRGKLTIDQQEANLRNELEKLGINVLKDLSVYDISAAYVRRRRDTLASQDYRLKLRDLAKISPVQELADRLNVASLDLIESKVSRLEEIKREVRIEAMKAALTKAEYLMSAIGMRVGKALAVRESDGEPTPYLYGGYATMNTNATSVSDRPLSFSEQKVKCAIVARFEIE
jgi:uncharacterized protein